MLAELNFCVDPTLEAKRQHKLSEDVEEYANVPRKRQTKNCIEDLNPYEAIPELPHVKLTEDDMNSDAVEIFMKLEAKYREFGAVRVTACDKWKCPFQERFVDKGITTRIQYLSKLKHGKVDNFLWCASRALFLFAPLFWLRLLNKMLRRIVFTATRRMLWILRGVTSTRPSQEAKH